MSLGFILLSVIFLFLLHFGIFSFLIYKFPVFFKYFYFVTITKKQENFFYGSVFFAVAIAGVFLFSKGARPVSLPVTMISFAGLLGAALFTAHFLKTDVLKTPYKALILGLFTVFALNSIPYAGDIIVLFLKAYGVGALFVCYKLKYHIKQIETENLSDEEKLKKISLIGRPHFSFVHIVSHLAALAVIAVYSVVLRNFAMDMANKITSEFKETQNISKIEKPKENNVYTK